MLENIITNLTDGVQTVFETVGSWLADHGINIVVLLLLGMVLRRLLTKSMLPLIKRTVRKDIFPTEDERKKRVKTIEDLVGTVIAVAVWLVVFIMFIGEIGVDTGPLVASAGVLGIALGFGAQTLIKDFTSGLFIILENQFRIGDVVKINDVAGVVQDITMRTTVLRDLDGNLHHIPNGSINVTTNMTMEYAGFHEEITVGLDTNVEQLVHVINHVGTHLAQKEELKDAILEPPHFERVMGFNNDGLLVMILGRTMPGEQWRVQGEFYKAIKKAFDKHGIEIPYPHLTIDSPEKKSKKS